MKSSALSSPSTTSGTKSSKLRLCASRYKCHVIRRDLRYISICAIPILCGVAALRESELDLFRTEYTEVSHVVVQRRSRPVRVAGESTEINFPCGSVQMNIRGVPDCHPLAPGYWQKRSLLCL